MAFHLVKLRPLRYMLPLALAPLLAPAVQAGDGLPPIKTQAWNTVPACATPGRLTAYLKARNPELDPRFYQLAGLYQRHGEAAGVRWDFVVFQMIVETASLTFRRPSGEPGAVRPEQMNFAGLGAAGGGAAGERFPDAETGVIAHLQHVKLYAGDPIAMPVAERTRKVQSWGVLQRWQRQLARPVTFADLAQHWAPGDRGYAAGMLSVARRFYAGICREPDPALALVAASRDRRAPATALATEMRPLADAPTVMPRAAPIGWERASLPAAAPALPPFDTSEARHGLGAGELARIETLPPAPSRAPLQSVRILNAAPQAAPIAEPPLVVTAKLPPAPPAAPEPDAADEALRALVVGRTVLLDTPIGSTIPISFQPDGTTRGKAGSLASYLGSTNDEGRWWIERARLCQRWKVWFDKETQCLRFKQAGEVIHWTRDDGKTGTARLARQ